MWRTMQEAGLCDRTIPYIHPRNSIYYRRASTLEPENEVNGLLDRPIF